MGSDEKVASEGANEDTRRLDFLQSLSEYGGWQLRPSTTGRGWRLLTTSADGSVPDIREAIDKVRDERSPS